MDTRALLPSGLHEAIVEQIPDALIFADREGLIRVWNLGAESVFGFSAEEALGKSLDLIVPERMRPAHWQGFEQALERGHTRLGNQVRTTRSIHKDGRKLYVELSFGLVIDASGAVAGALAMARDCSERFLEDKALRARLAELEGSAP